MENNQQIRGVFVTGTGTDVGKTIVTGALLRAIADLGFDPCALKPLQTGISGSSPSADAAVYLLFAPDAHVDTLRSYALAASPALAATHEGEELQADQIIQSIHEYFAQSGKNFLILEGAGGIHAPINATMDMLDLIKLLGLPCVLASANRLGAVNRTVLSLNALVGAGLTISGVVLTDTSPPVTPEQELVFADNAGTIARLAKNLPGSPPFVRLPHMPKLDPETRTALSRMLQPVAKKLVEWKAHRTGLAARDRAALWHPYESPLAPGPLHEAEATSANHIFLRDGTKLVDGMSSWWATIHGYRPPAIMNALAAQAGKMPHVMFGGFTHEPAVALAERLLLVLPSHLRRIFFCDSGSVAVEVAMKLALQYQVAIGQPQRKKFLTIAGGYHGDTFGAMSVCDPVGGMHAMFRGYLPEQLFLPKPRSPFGGKFAPEDLEPAKQLLIERGDEIAALILEPIVQGAGGMWFYHPQYLNELAKLCQARGILLIYDEIATGFGRTGKYFATSWTDTKPDILCIGKALTGGVLSLAATVCSEHVVAALGKMPLMHGPTFMANPLACAAACASLDILAENHWQAQVGALEKELLAGLSPCRSMPGVANVRVLGAIGVVEMEEDVNIQALTKFFTERGVWLRPFRNLIYVMPPYITPLSDLGRLCSAIRDAVKAGIWKKHEIETEARQGNYTA